MSIGRKKFISKIEGLVYRNIYNDQNQIRYPITLNGNIGIKGQSNILKVTKENEDIFYSGHYKFGANKLFIYQAIDDILKYLEQEAFLDTTFIEDELEEEED